MYKHFIHVGSFDELNIMHYFTMYIVACNGYEKHCDINYSPALKKWGYTGFTLSFRRSVLPIFRYSVHKSVTTNKL